MIENKYSGHRERLRERFTKNKFSGFHDYEVLEFLLTFIFRQGDVKPLAKKLIETFGSYSKVLDASKDELKNVKGMRCNAAQSIVAFREAMSYYFEDSVQTGRMQITKMSSLIEFLRSQLGQKENEVLYAIFLNAKNEVLLAKELGEGTVSQALVFPRKIVEEGLKIKATSLILAHNHPGGIAEPSDSDISITEEIIKAINLVDITLQDHIIISNNDYFSFNRNNLL